MACPKQVLCKSCCYYSMLDLAISLVRTSSLQHSKSGKWYSPHFTKTKGRWTSNYLLHAFEKRYKEFSHQKQRFLCFSKLWPPPSEQKSQFGDWAWLSRRSHNHSYPSTSSSCNQPWPQIWGTDMCHVPQASAAPVFLQIPFLTWARLGEELALVKVHGLPLIQPSEHPSLTCLPSAKLWHGCHLLPFLHMIKNGSTPQPHPVWYAVCRDCVSISYLPLPTDLYKQETAF